MSLAELFRPVAAASTLFIVTLIWSRTREIDAREATRRSEVMANADISRAALEANARREIAKIQAENNLLCIEATAKLRQSASQEPEVFIFPSRPTM